MLPYVREKVESLALTSLDDIIAKAEIFFHKSKNVKISDHVQVFSVQDSTPSQLQLEHGPSGVAEQGAAENSQGSKQGESRQRNSFKGLCYKCQKPGHRARECWSKAPKGQQDNMQSFMESMKAFFDQMKQSPQVADTATEQAD